MDGTTRSRIRAAGRRQEARLRHCWRNGPRSGDLGLAPAARCRFDGRRDRERGVHLGESGPDGGGFRAVSLAEVPDCLGGELLRLAVPVRNCHQTSSCRRAGGAVTLPTYPTLPVRGPGHIINPASPKDMARAADYLVW